MSLLQCWLDWHDLVPESDYDRRRMWDENRFCVKCTRCRYGGSLFCAEGPAERRIIAKVKKKSLSDNSMVLNVNGQELFIEVVRGSMLEQDAECIVNAANTAMRGGGGIDGLIHQKSGPELMRYLEANVSDCDTGEVVVTPGFNTGARHIVHTPGPIYKEAGVKAAQLLSSCYTNSLREANNLRDKSVALCSIATGIYGYPIDEAAEIAMHALFYSADWWSLGSPLYLRRVTFAMYGNEEYDAFCNTLQLMKQVF